MREAVAKYEVVSMVLVWSPLVWNVTLCSLRYMYQRCRGSCPLGVSGTSMKSEDGVSRLPRSVGICVHIRRHHISEDYHQHNLKTFLN